MKRKPMKPGETAEGTSSEIKGDIEATLVQMHETLDAINARISFRSVMDKMRHFFTTPAGKVLLVVGIGAIAKRKPLLTAVTGGIYLVRKLASKKPGQTEPAGAQTPSSPGEF